MSMKRLFVAIHLQAEKPLRDFVQLLQTNLRHEDIKWVNPAQLHLTLKFIGETAAANIPRIAQALDEAVAGIKPFSLSFDKHGLFGSRYQPRVIWIGPATENPVLLSLANTVLDAMDRIGYARDRQNLVPHLTLGRIRFLRDKPAFHRFFDGLPDQNYLHTSVDQFHLYESVLKPTGAVYSIHHSCHLGL